MRSYCSIFIAIDGGGAADTAQLPIPTALLQQLTLTLGVPETGVNFLVVNTGFVPSASVGLSEGGVSQLIPTSFIPRLQAGGVMGFLQGYIDGQRLLAWDRPMVPTHLQVAR